MCRHRKDIQSAINNQLDKSSISYRLIVLQTTMKLPTSCSLKQTNRKIYSAIHYSTSSMKKKDARFCCAIVLDHQLNRVQHFTEQRVQPIYTAENSLVDG